MATDNEWFEGRQVDGIGVLPMPFWFFLLAVARDHLGFRSRLDPI